MTARFFRQEKPDSAFVLRLSALTPAGRDDLILGAPLGGESLAAGSKAAIEWTYVWTIPNRPTATARVRVSGVTGAAQDASPRVFRILGQGATAKGSGFPEPVRLRLPGGRAVLLAAPPFALSIRVHDVRGALIADLPVREGRAESP